jgi:signal transduction histidine kinase
MLGVVGDITEQKRALAALEDADRRKDEFLATLAHELRNPLAPLRNSLAILQRSADDPATFEKASGVMERQLSHLVRLIDDLLDVSRISLDKLVLRVELADLAPCSSTPSRRAGLRRSAPATSSRSACPSARSSCRVTARACRRSSAT